MGPIRGTRVYQWALREEWDCPFVFAGGQETAGTSILDFIALHKVDSPLRFDLVHKDSNPVSSRVFQRASERNSPYNMIADLAYIVNDAWPEDPETGEPFQATLPNWRFSEKPTQGKETAARMDIRYDEGGDYHAAYLYSGEDRAYHRLYNGEPHTDFNTGKQIVVSNVIVQYTAIEYYGDEMSRPVLHTTGTGTMDAFIDGKHIRGTWRRQYVDSQTEYFDGDGNPLVLLPGKTFIQVVPPDLVITFEDAEGTVHQASAV